MGKILLIGNGPSALENKMGERIDSNEFAKVIRFNRWKFEEDGQERKDNYSEYVGTRCDYWIINDLHLTETMLGINKRDLYERVFVYMPKFKLNANPHLVKTVNSKFDNIKFIPPHIEDQIDNIIDTKPSWPTTGLIGLGWVIDCMQKSPRPDEIYFYGFDSYDLKYKSQHYFEDENSKYGRNKYIENTQDHTPSIEKEYINYMVKNNKIKKLI
jgi:hypothetical protein